MRLLILAFLFSGSWIYSQEWCENPIGGMTLVAPPQPFESDPMLELKDVNVAWVAVVPYAFTPKNEARVHFGNNHQWWGETPEGAKETIRLAKKNNLGVMLKPQVWMHGSWVGDMEFEKESDWLQWESDYRDYIITFAKIAAEHEVEILCVGTEFKRSAVIREQYWRDLIGEIRTIYKGDLTYSANWDEFESMPFWDALNLIGISSYFPLSDEAEPSISKLKKAWNPVKKSMEAVSQKYNKAILFTEYGYLSVDGCAGKTWILEKKRHDLPTNEKAQCNALEALYTVFSDEKYWAGCFYWKWYPYNYHRRNRRANDYTPQGKMAENTIRKWYGAFNGISESNE